MMMTIKYGQLTTLCYNQPMSQKIVSSTLPLIQVHSISEEDSNTQIKRILAEIPTITALVFEDNNAVSLDLGSRGQGKESSSQQVEISQNQDGLLYPRRIEQIVDSDQMTPIDGSLKQSNFIPSDFFDSLATSYLSIRTVQLMKKIMEEYWSRYNDGKQSFKEKLVLFQAFLLAVYETKSLLKEQILNQTELFIFDLPQADIIPYLEIAVTKILSRPLYLAGNEGNKLEMLEQLCLLTKPNRRLSLLCSALEIRVHFDQQPIIKLEENKQKAKEQNLASEVDQETRLSTVLTEKPISVNKIINQINQQKAFKQDNSLNQSNESVLSKVQELNDFSIVTEGKLTDFDISLSMLLAQDQQNCVTMENHQKVGSQEI